MKSNGNRQAGRSADYIVLNVSSPNTPGLRLLQKKDFLDALVSQCIAVRDEILRSQTEGVADIGCMTYSTGKTYRKQLPLLIKVNSIHYFLQGR